MEKKAFGNKTAKSGSDYIKPTGWASPGTLKLWVDVKQGQLYLKGTRCLFSLGWPPFQ